MIFLCCWTPSKKEFFWYTRIHSLLVNWRRLSVESRTLTCPFKQNNPSVWSLLSWHPTHTHLWMRLSVFLKLFVSTITDSDYVNRSASLQQFRWIHQRRARQLHSDEGGHQYQALDRFILQKVLACRRRRARLSTKHEVGRKRYWRKWWILRQNL